MYIQVREHHRLSISDARCGNFIRQPWHGKLKVILGEREEVKLNLTIPKSAVYKDTLLCLVTTTPNPVLQILFIRCKQRNTHQADTLFVPVWRFFLRTSGEPRPVLLSADDNNVIPAVLHVLWSCSYGSFVALTSSSTHPSSHGPDAECPFTPHGERWLVDSTTTQRSCLTRLVKALAVRSLLLVISVIQKYRVHPTYYYCNSCYKYYW